MNRLCWKLLRTSFLLMLSFLFIANRLFAADSDPASVDQAIKVLDLRTAALPDGAASAEMQQVGSVNYEIKKDPKAAYQAQQQILIKLGCKELPGSTVEAAYGSGMFQKASFVLTVSTSESGQPGMSRVSVTNFGNVRPASLPVIKSAKSSFANEATAMYFTDTKPADVIAETRKLFLDAGWEPYGANTNSPDLASITFKRNAIQAQVNVSVAPAQQGKTSIMYSALLLSADIPAPPTAGDVQYVDMLKTLRFTSSDNYDDVGKFYQQSLVRRGWTPTTEELIKSQDRFKRPIASQIYRNAAKDFLSLDLSTQNEKTHVVVKHLTADELALLEQKAREQEQKLAAEREAREKKAPKTGDTDPAKVPAAKGNAVAIPIPLKVKKVDQTSDNVLQIKVAAGKGQAAAKLIRDQLVAAKWKLDDDGDLDEMAGNLTFQNGDQQITLAFVDTGVTDVTVMLIGIGVNVEPAKAGAKATETEPAKKPEKK